MTAKQSKPTTLRLKTLLIKGFGISSFVIVITLLCFSIEQDANDVTIATPLYAEKKTERKINHNQRKEKKIQNVNNETKNSNKKIFSPVRKQPVIDLSLTKAIIKNTEYKMKVNRVQTNLKNDQIVKNESKTWEKNDQIVKIEPKTWEENDQIVKIEPKTWEKNDQIVKIEPKTWEENDQIVKIEPKTWEENDQIVKIEPKTWEENDQIVKIEPKTWEENDQIVKIEPKTWEENDQIVKIEPKTWEENDQIVKIEPKTWIKMDQIVKNESKTWEKNDQIVKNESKTWEKNDQIVKNEPKTWIKKDQIVKNESKTWEKNNQIVKIKPKTWENWKKKYQIVKNESKTWENWKKKYQIVKNEPKTWEKKQPVANTEDKMKIHYGYNDKGHKMSSEERANLVIQRCEIFKKENPNFFKETSYRYDNEAYMVSKQYKLLLCYNCKVASTNQKRLLYALDNKYEDDLNSISQPVAREYASKRYRPFRKVQSSTNGFYKVMLIREPLERLLSAFRDERSYKLFFTKAEPKFKDYLQLVLDENLDKMNRHNYPYYERCRPCEMKYDLVGLQKTFNTDMNTVLRKINATTIITAPRREKTGYSSVTTDQLLKEYYSKIPHAMIHQLWKKFYKDYYIFGYPYPKHLMF